MSGVVVIRLGLAISMPVSVRFLVSKLLLILAIAMSFYAALNLGTTPTALGDALRALLLPVESLDQAGRMVANFRLPRTGVALLAGAMMAASGYLLQVVSRNGLADPGILGLSDGSALTVMGASFLFGSVAAGMLSWLALGGALATAVLVLGLGRHLLSGGGIILVGLAVNIVLGSVIEMILVSGSAMDFAHLMNWSRGTLASVDRLDMTLLAQWFAVLLPLSLLTSRSMQPMLLGDDAALTLGVRSRLIFVWYVLLAAAFAAPVVAVCGPIAFVGLISAYVARGLIGDRPTEVLVTSMLVGALIVLWADTAGRTLFAPIVVSAGIMVSVVGVLTFIISARLGRQAQLSNRRD
jgi:iron complex transport system permease protein